MRYFLYSLATDKSRGFIPGVIKLFLSGASFFYSLVVRLLAFFYRLNSHRLPCKVISIGNITLGGTGKTVLAEFVSRYLQGKSRKVAVLSRGYKRQAGDCPADSGSYASMGDEPFMLSRKLGNIPVIVGADRVKSAQKAIKDYGTDTVILDDGFQQWRIKKDLEIVVIDTLNPFGNRRLLPRGILRQPLSALRGADIFVLTKVNLSPQYQELKDFLSRINQDALIVESVHRPLGFYRLDGEGQPLKPEALRGERVTLFSGIGDPDSFEALAKSLGINVGLSLRFPDHHHYSEGDLQDIVRRSKASGITRIITTEKDAIRLPHNKEAEYGVQFLFLGITLKITKNEEGFCARLLKLYSL